MNFLRNLHKNPQKKLKALVMVELTTKKVGVELSYARKAVKHNQKAAICKTYIRLGTFSFLR
ncbi:hypothetical protein MTR_4g121010 [Medicago truncatula]|uniref:Uncharacterized protein n=1 Tax=Medicago truncatula TaxID=3880 RepID=A0A072UR79_MEDTR|nr:hypothetical protein MTR_4g121010 [Medicago truncatula]